MNRPARMSDVAKLAEVSVMTVSRVLNGTVRVSEGARVRVLKAVSMLNYLPNEVARSLRSSSTNQIGVIVPNLYDPFFAQCANAISIIAKKHSYSTVITTSDEDPEIEHTEALRMLRRHIDGLIVIPTSHLSKLHSPDFAGMPIVILDRPIPNGSFDCVLVDNKSGAEMAVRHLIGHRHRRIACIGLSRKVWTVRERIDGYVNAMAAAGLKPDSRSISDSQDEMLQTIQALMGQSKPPTALFCTNNLTTRYALHSLCALNVVIPRDLALVGFDDFDMADIIRPAVTVVRQPVDLLGRTAAELLFGRLSSDEPSGKPKRMVVPLELVIRDSCGTHV